MKRVCCGAMFVTSLFAMQVMAEKAGTADLNSDGKVTKEEFVEIRSQMAEAERLIMHLRKSSFWSEMPMAMAF